MLRQDYSHNLYLNQLFIVMKKTLIIVESPAKCAKIEKFLGVSYKVMGSYGHITHLSNLNQIEVENNYKPNFQISESKQTQIDKLTKLLLYLVT